MKSTLVKVKLLDDMYPHKKGDEISMKLIVAQWEAYRNKVKILDKMTKKLENEVEELTNQVNKWTALEENQNAESQEKNEEKTSSEPASDENNDTDITDEEKDSKKAKKEWNAMDKVKNMLLGKNKAVLNNKNTK